jgi:hypothetical protein
LAQVSSVVRVKRSVAFSPLASAMLLGSNPELPTCTSTPWAFAAA